LKPFRNDVPIFSTEEDDEQIIYYGSTKLVQLVNDNPELRKKAALFYSPEMHAVSWYGPRFGEDYLNAGARKMTAEELANSPTSDKDFFVRPDVGIKLFSGKVMDANMFRNIYYGKAQVGSVEMKPDTIVWVNEPVHIGSEYRTWWIGGEVVAVVLYSYNGKIAPRLLNEDEEDRLEEITEFARIQGAKISEAEAFVLDVALCPCESGYRGEYRLKVVEINCVHSSGFYDVGVIQPVVCALTDYVRNRNKGK
jgi:hypothetical protein